MKNTNCHLKNFHLEPESPAVENKIIPFKYLTYSSGHEAEQAA